MILLSPHNDDEVLFCSYEIQRHASEIQVVIVYDSYVQPARGQSQCSLGARRQESIEALRVMEVAKPPIFLGLRDDDQDASRFDLLIDSLTDAISSEAVVCGPAWHEGGNRHHNRVAEWHRLHFPDSPRYCTYRNNSEKVREGTEVTPAHWSHVERKLRALACYRSQISIPECQHFFINDLKEYVL